MHMRRAARSRSHARAGATELERRSTLPDDAMGVAAEEEEAVLLPRAAPLLARQAAERDALAAQHRSRRRLALAPVCGAEALRVRRRRRLHAGRCRSRLPVNVEFG